MQTLDDGLHSGAVPADHGRTIAYHTSGSTGRPLRGVETELSHFFFGALNLRDHLWQRRDFGGTFAAIRTQVDGRAPARLGPRHRGGVPTPVPRSRCPSTRPLERQLDWLLAHDPDYLLTHP